MCESCHLDRSLNVEIAVEYQMIFVVCFLTVPVKFSLGHFQDLEGACGDFILKAAQKFILFSTQQKTKK